MDIALKFTGLSAFDLSFSANDIGMDSGLESAVIISLFTDRIVEVDELPVGETWRRGFWADHVSDIDGDKYGSRLWLLAREKQTEATRVKAEEYALEALDWLKEDGVAKDISVRAEWIGRGQLGLEIKIERPEGESLNYKFKSVWDNHGV